jgi:hypothetical protein
VICPWRRSSLRIHEASTKDNCSQIRKKFEQEFDLTLLDPKNVNLELDETSGIFDFYKLMYGYLGIIDSKTGSLLRFNAIIFTGLTFFMGLTKTGIVQSDITKLHNFHFCVTTGAVSIVLSAIALTLLMFCIYNKWDLFFYSKGAYFHRLDHLVQLRNRRTVLYRVAWFLNLLSLAFLFLTVILLLV